MTLCWSLDKAGPIARVVRRRLARAARARSGRAADSRDHLGADVRGLRIGHVPSLVRRERPRRGRSTARRSTRSRDAGCEIVEVAIPEFPYATLRTILSVEAAASMEELSLSGKDDELAQQEADSWPNSFRAARFFSAVDFVQADRLRRRVVDAFDTLFRPLDAHDRAELRSDQPDAARDELHGATLPRGPGRLRPRARPRPRATSSSRARSRRRFPTASRSGRSPTTSRSSCASAARSSRGSAPRRAGPSGI